MKRETKKIYKLLRAHFGYQNWWPGETATEIAIGAILTQNTNWGNVEKAIDALKKADALSLDAVLQMPEKKLARLIKPSGYYNQKAIKLKEFSARVQEKTGLDIKRLRRYKLENARDFLLSIKGVGPETADSILLYALGFPTFVIDAYTMRIFRRLGFFDEKTDYETAKGFFESNLKTDVKLYNDYHAQLVALGKYFCKNRSPLCGSCPLAGYCDFARECER